MSAQKTLTDLDNDEHDVDQNDVKNDDTDKISNNNQLSSTASLLGEKDQNELVSVDELGDNDQKRECSRK